MEHLRHYKLDEEACKLIKAKCEEWKNKEKKKQIRKQDKKSENFMPERSKANIPTRVASLVFAEILFAVQRCAPDTILARLISTATPTDLRIYFEAAKNITYSILPVSNKIFRQLNKHKKLILLLGERGVKFNEKKTKLAKVPEVIRILTNQIAQKFDLKAKVFEKLNYTSDSEDSDTEMSSVPLQATKRKSNAMIEDTMEPELTKRRLIIDDAAE